MLVEEGWKRFAQLDTPYLTATVAAADFRALIKEIRKGEINFCPGRHGGRLKKEEWGGAKFFFIAANLIEMSGAREKESPNRMKIQSRRECTKWERESALPVFILLQPLSPSPSPLVCPISFVSTTIARPPIMTNGSTVDRYN